jgi:hypothetical protein
MGDAGSSYVDEPQWHSKTRPLRVICVGSGATGLLLACKMKKKLDMYDLAIYEKLVLSPSYCVWQTIGNRNPQIGGTWYENRYPGCACDV